ncbi:hypothetical protein HS088_TW22G00838 [Tripterygium wilfordii]|uniref:Uncharacterized protein n=1 Tax=Tripterygium wilfordii TaxID=458696 RepID=A0A7J7BZ62_TRIWF|nr:hypothetical protein HS088_TW22G00838 [Tripterygium wilfordii]
MRSSITNQRTPKWHKNKLPVAGFRAYLTAIHVLVHGLHAFDLVVEKESANEPEG